MTGALTKSEVTKIASNEAAFDIFLCVLSQNPSNGRDVAETKGCQRYIYVQFF